MTLYLSENACPALKERLLSDGFALSEVRSDPRLGEHTGDHADLRFLRLGEKVFRRKSEDFSPDYPLNAAFCALIVGDLFIHRLDITAPELLSAAKNAGLRLINVRQGYARCAALPVDGHSAITADAGIAKALRAEGCAVLEIRGGGVLLPGFETGFIGGCGGVFGGAAYLNGGLDTHPDGERIRGFLAARGVKIFDIPGLKLRDIGSIV